MDDKEFKKDWIHQCLMEFIGQHLTGMDDYFKKCWTETGMVKGVSSYNKWFEDKAHHKGFLEGLRSKVE